MSPREQAQHAIAAYLVGSRFWNAPYGTIEGMRDLPRGGKVREITFGVSRVLDASITIWSATRIEVSGRGALAYAVAGVFGSAEACIAHLREVAHEEEGR